jgi:nicotinamidase-related amidase
MQPIFRRASILVGAALFAGAAFAAAGSDVISQWDQAKAPKAPDLKSVTIDPGKTALILMDFDKNTCTIAKRVRCAEAIPRIAALAADARAHKVLVMNFYNQNMTRDDIVPQLAPAQGESAEKVSGDKFFGTDLDKVLKAHGVTTVILSGTSANGAVLATALGAYENHYKAIVPVDAMPADDLYQEQFSAWNMANGPGWREVTTLTRIDMIKFGS